MGIEALNYTLIRKPRRRSVTISISPENHLTLTVPRGFPESEIPHLLERQASWIEKKMQKNQEIGVRYPIKKYQEGDLFPFLGKHYALRVIEGPRRDIHLVERRLQVIALRDDIQGRDGENLASMIRAWYEGMAQQILEERVALYQNEVQVTPGSIRIRTMAGQWGSCAITGNLCFNSRLIMAPVEVVDYVVVHELSHVRHHNHSVRFWQLVESVIPDYRAHRKWLREHGNFLTLE